MISVNDILTSSGHWNERPVEYPPTDEMVTSATALASAVNAVLIAFGQDRTVNSGYRPAPINVAAGGMRGDAHETCQAVDLDDKPRDLARWCLDNVATLVELGLYMEDPRWTPTWVHLQLRPVPSGHHVFIPSEAPPLVGWPP